MDHAGGRTSLTTDLHELRAFDELRHRMRELRRLGQVFLAKYPSLPQASAVMAMNNRFEHALVLRASMVDELAESPTHASSLDRLQEIAFSDLFPEGADEDEVPGASSRSEERFDQRVPVLLAAFAMQALVKDSGTALSTASLRCYYRILCELHLALRPEWTLGAARAGDGGSVSAYVTGQCVRAIDGLRKAVDHTAEFLRSTSELFRATEALRGVVESLGLGPDRPDHPIARWVQLELARVVNDWRISARLPRRPNILFLGDLLDEPPHLLEQLKPFFDRLDRELLAAVRKVESSLAIVTTEAADHASTGGRTPRTAAGTREDEESIGRRGKSQRMAREFALELVRGAHSRAEGLLTIAGRNQDLGERLAALAAEFDEIARRIDRVLDPSRQYAESVLDRAIADSAGGEMDAGELVFAAATFGSTTRWQVGRDRLHRACELVLSRLPSDGMLTTKRPFHSTARGYKRFATACEMLRSLAVVIQRIQYPIRAEHVRTIVDGIASRAIPVAGGSGWTFDGATQRETASVWVTAVTLMSLERLERMVNKRINNIVLGHFDVRQPAELAHAPALNDLILPDFGLREYYTGDGGRRPELIATVLEEMRAHVEGVPRAIQAGPRHCRYSAVLYGPPQTGKTTLAAAIARSAHVPLVQLSPFDLVADPSGGSEQSSIQSRARAVFEALAMLTNVVILFDEFESVLQQRESAQPDPARPYDRRGQGASRESQIPFLVTGLLPKLVKLHEAAERQGIAYLLATNDIDRLDRAAVRHGRFDEHLAIYPPDPLSRIGALLYRLELVRIWARGLENPPEWANEILTAEPRRAVTTLKEVSRTSFAFAGDLASTYFRLPGFIRAGARPADWRVRLSALLNILEPPADDASRDNGQGGHSAPVALPRAEGAWLKRYEDSFQARFLEATTAIAQGRTDLRYWLDRVFRPGTV